MNGAAQTTCCC